MWQSEWLRPYGYVHEEGSLINVQTIISLYYVPENNDHYALYQGSSFCFPLPLCVAMFSTNTYCTQLKLNDSYFTGNSQPKLKSIHQDASRGLSSSFSKYRKGCNFLTYLVLWWTVLTGCCPGTYI